MKRKPLASSTLASADFDEDNRVLEIEFTNGKVYRYLGTPRNAFLGLLESLSKGEYFNRFIRDKYPYERIL